MFNEKLDDIVAAIEQAYDADEIRFNDTERHFPNKANVQQIILDLRRVFFPRFFGNEAPCGAGPKYFIGNTLSTIEEALHREVYEALLFRDGDTLTPEEAEKKSSEICSNFFYRLPELQRILLTDVQAAFDGDPAAQSNEEII